MVGEFLQFPIFGELPSVWKRVVLCSLLRQSLGFFCLSLSEFFFCCFSSGYTLFSGTLAKYLQCNPTV